MQKSLWILVFAVACGGEADKILDGLDDGEFSSEEDLRMWAGQSSAPMVYYQAFLPVFTVEIAQDESCPNREDDGDRTIYEADGCSDEDGNTYDGRMVIDSGDQEESLVYEDFTISTQSYCPGATGPNTLTYNGELHQEGRSEQAFEIDIVMDAEGLNDATCEPLSAVLAIDYEGVLEGTAMSATQTWSGSGRIGGSEVGVVRASTEDEVTNQEACSYEAMSGTTTLKAGGHEAVITYDGATSCDIEGIATWTYDGDDQGEITGVHCATGGALGGSWLPALLAALLARRRRSRG